MTPNLLARHERFLDVAGRFLIGHHLHGVAATWADPNQGWRLWGRRYQVEQLVDEIIWLTHHEENEETRGP